MLTLPGHSAHLTRVPLTELRNRGVADVCIVVCDGLKGLPDAITTTGRSRWSRPASCT